jgi:hypothetical protein
LTQEHAENLTDRDVFLAWVRTALYEAELALHNGDLAPRRALWSRNEPVSVLGAWRNAQGQQEIDELFTSLGNSFSDCTICGSERMSVWENRTPPVLPVQMKGALAPVTGARGGRPSRYEEGPADPQRAGVRRR